jgi:hypothetical protein
MWNPPATDKEELYPLGVGSSDQRYIPHNKDASLGSDYDKIYKALFELYRAAAFHPQGGPQKVLISAIWLLWCYVSHDLEALRQRVIKLEGSGASLFDQATEQLSQPGGISVGGDGIAQLQTEIKQLREELAELQQRFGDSAS